MNILFDGSRLWVIDWGSAWASDCYVDLASAANFFAQEEADEEALLLAYFGDSLDHYKRARLFLMRQVSYMQYGMALLRAAPALRTSESVHDETMETPPLRQVLARIGSGDFSLASYSDVLLLGKSLLNESLRQMKTPRFDQSLREMV